MGGPADADTCGGTFAGRVAASLLNGLGMAELVAKTPAEYQDIAIELATNRAALARLRQRTMDNRHTRPLFDIRLFTAHLETAYRTMHDRYRSDRAPEHFYVKA